MSWVCMRCAIITSPTIEIQLRIIKEDYQKLRIAKTVARSNTLCSMALLDLMCASWQALPHIFTGCLRAGAHGRGLR